MIEHLLNSVPASFKLKVLKEASSVTSVCMLASMPSIVLILCCICCLAALHLGPVSWFADLLFLTKSAELSNVDIFWINNANRVLSMSKLLSFSVQDVFPS